MSYVKTFNLNANTIGFRVYLIIMNFSLSAQEKTEIPLAEITKVNSKVLNEERFAIVHTPKNYDKNTNKYQILKLIKFI